MMTEVNDTEKDELIRESINNLRYEKRLTAHPDCRDPDHPGCKKCEPEYFSEKP